MNNMPNIDTELTATLRMFLTDTRTIAAELNARGLLDTAAASDLIRACIQAQRQLTPHLTTYINHDYLPL